MRKLIAVAVCTAALAGGAGAAEAKGCVRGAVAGGVVGHFAGHHPIAGAAVGCVVAHHHYTHQRHVQQRQARRAATHY